MISFFNRINESNDPLFTCRIATRFGTIRMSKQLLEIDLKFASVACSACSFPIREIKVDSIINSYIHKSKNVASFFSYRAMEKICMQNRAYLYMLLLLILLLFFGTLTYLNFSACTSPFFSFFLFFWSIV